LSIGDGNHYLPTHDLAFQMGIIVILIGLINSYQSTWRNPLAVKEASLS